MPIMDHGRRDRNDPPRWDRLMSLWSQRCPLCPQEQTSAARLVMSAKGQKTTWSIRPIYGLPQRWLLDWRVAERNSGAFSAHSGTGEKLSAM
jgi:hypothetical protein